MISWWRGRITWNRWLRGLRKFKDTTLFDEFDQVGDRSHLKHLPANYEDINGKEVKSLINKDKWNLNTKLYHNKYQLNKKKKVELLQYNEENSKHYRLTDMTEGDDDYNEALKSRVGTKSIRRRKKKRLLK